MQLLLCLSALLPFAIQALPSPESWSVRVIPTSFRAAREAGRVAVQYLNYHSGSPHHLVYLDEVKKATVKESGEAEEEYCNFKGFPPGPVGLIEEWKTVPEIGNKFYIEFTTKDYESNQETGTCTAAIFYHTAYPGPAVHVNCSSSRSLKKAREDDYNFYKQMKKQTIPISGEDIPDSFGFIDPDFIGVWYLAIMGSSFAMWKETFEGRSYTMAQIKNVKQLLRKDDYISFDYDILLHELPTEEMVSCNLHVVWIPGRPPKVDYHCTHKLENGSGTEPEEGSTFLGNFK